MRNEYEKLIRDAEQAVRNNGKGRRDMRALAKIDQRLDLFCLHELNNVDNLRFFSSSSERYYRAACLRSEVRSLMDDARREEVRLGRL